jgi:RNA polymerase sigma-70 factor (ECF subfamily)
MNEPVESSGKALMEERELVKSLAERNASSLRYAIDCFGGYVHAVIRNTVKGVGTPADFEELTSDVFAALWDNASRLAPNSHLKAWLAVVARNRALRWARTQHLEVALPDENLVTYELEPDLLANWEQQQESDSVTFLELIGFAQLFRA